MHIVLVITDTMGRSRVFVTETLKAFRLQETREQVTQGKLPSLHIVHTGPGAYLRSKPNAAAADNPISKKSCGADTRKIYPSQAFLPGIVHMAILNSSKFYFARQECLA